MASEYVTITPEFDVPTYDEMVKPLDAAEAAYDAAEQGLYELDANAQKWGQYARLNPNLGARYNAYMDDLQDAANELMRTGDISAARSGMLRLYRRYQSDVQPIETCATAKAAAVKAARDTQEKSGGTTIFEFDPSMVSLDDIYANPDLLDSNRSVSGKDIAERTKAIMENFAKADCGNMSDEQWSAFLYGMFGPQYYEAVINKGLSQSQVARMISEGDSSLFGYISDLILEPTGILGWRSVNGDKGSYNYRTAQKYVEQAFWSGMGEAQRLQVENKDYSILGRAWASGAGGASGANPNDMRDAYRWVDVLGRDTKDDERTRQQAASDAAYVQSFIGENPDLSGIRVSHVESDEERDLARRELLANHFHRKDVDPDTGQVIYPELSSYSDAELQWLAAHDIEPDRVVPDPNYERISSIVRSVTGNDFDGTREQLDNVLASLQGRSERKWGREAVFNTEDARLAGEQIVNGEYSQMIDAAIGAHGLFDSKKSLDGYIWTEHTKGRNLKTSERRPSDAALKALKAGDYTQVRYSPQENCFKFYVHNSKVDEVVCLNASVLFNSNPVLKGQADAISRYTRMGIDDTITDDELAQYNDMVQNLMYGIITMGNSRMQGQPKTTTKASVSYPPEYDE